MSLPLTDRVKKVRVMAINEAIRLKQDYVGTEHLMLGIIKEGGGTAMQVLNNLGIDTNELARKIEESMFGDGGTMVQAASILPFTPRAKKTLDNAGIEARNLNSAVVGTEHLLLAMIRDPGSQPSAVLTGMGLDYEQIREAVEAIKKEKSEEDAKMASGMQIPGRYINPQPAAVRKSMTPFLDHYGRNLNALAKEGKLDPVIGRVKEIERVIQILSRRKKNNPLLIGEPGTGKTAIVEGLAQKIVNHDVPQILENKVVYSLDLSQIVAGTQYRGQFEERMKALITELQKNENIVVFIDEIHTIVGAGSASGTLDAANIFKPALARGEVKCVGATTLDEYRRYFESDAALDRRFQSIMVEPPSVAETIQIIGGLKKAYEDHHKVKYTDKAINEAVVLADRYISERFLPDKAIDVIDEAGALKRLSGMEVPQEIRDLEHEMEEAERAKNIAAGEQNYEEAARQKSIQDNLKDALSLKNKEWQENLNENVLIVDEQIISQVISSMTGIPLNQLEEQESQKLLNLEEHLRTSIVGQEEALEAVAKSIRRSRAGLRNIKRPIASFIFLGPTGVGKTELAKALAKELFNSEDALVRIDMSEFMEKFEVSKLIGSAPGFVGYEDAGQLSEKVRKKPYSVVLFDEIEKAHPDVFNTLLQVLDDGRLTDNKGRTVDFKNTIVIMTSNAGSHLIQDALGKMTDKNREQILAQCKLDVLNVLRETIRPEFLNRIDEIVMFNPLTRGDVRQIVAMQLNNIREMLANNGVNIIVTDYVMDYLVENGYDPLYGARPVKRLLQREITNELAKQVLAGTINKEHAVTIDYFGENLVFSNK